MVRLPRGRVGVYFFGRAIYAFALGGFALYHIGEKYLYQHITHRNELIKDLAHLHLAGFLIDGMLIGVSTVLFFGVYSDFTALMLFLPLALHTVASTISTKHIHQHFKSGIAEKFLLSSAPFLGALFATIAGLHTYEFYMIFAPVVGMLLYIVIRGVLPRDRNGEPFWFLIGALISMLLLKAEHVGL